MTIEEIQAVFEDRRPDLAATHEGEWVLLFDDGSVRFFDLENDAVSSGLRDRSGRDFVVNQALTEEPIITLSSVVLTEQPL